MAVPVKRGRSLRRSRRASGLAALVAVSVAVPHGLAAQAIAGQTASTSPVEALGRLHVLVFVGTVPVPGAQIRAAKAVDTTSASGSGWLAVPGGHHTVAVLAPGAEAPHRVVEVPNVPLVPGETTQLIVTLDAQGGLVSKDLEAPRASQQFATEAFHRAVEDGPKGRVQGSVTSTKTGAPVAGARVYVRGAPVEAESDAQGRFELTLPAGTYSLSVIHSDFSTLSLSKIEVVAGSPASVRAELEPAAVQLDDFIVTAPFIRGGVAELVQERRDTSAVADVIGSEQMARSGDSSAASALRRVTGITLVGGKYIYVRGMGERYSSTLLNGAQLPSPEPERRVVPLDMFPAGVIESVLIQKTYSPDRPGEFGGGVVQMRSRAYPDELRLSASLSLGANTQTTLSNGLGYEGGGLDWLGFDDGTRELPAPIAQAAGGQRISARNRFSPPGEGFTRAELETLGETLSNVWQPRRTRVPLNTGLSLSVGNSYEVRKARVGFLLSGLYSNGYQRRLFERNKYGIGSGDQLKLVNNFRFDETEHTVKLAAMLDGGISMGDDHEIRVTSILLRMTDDLARFYEGLLNDINAKARVTRLRFVERQEVSQQFRGEHRFSQLAELRLAWHYAFSKAKRAEPDRRDTRYEEETGSGASGQPSPLYIIATTADNDERLWGEMDERMHDIGLDASLPFAQWTGQEGQLKVGAALARRDRVSDVRRYKFLTTGIEDPSIKSLPPNQLFSPQYIGPGGLEFAERTLPTDHYEGQQTVLAGYAMAELPLVAGLDMMAGLRVERGRQRVATLDPFIEDQPEVGQFDNTDLLPAATLTWHAFDELQLRAGYSRTLSRPEFREMSTASYTDSIGRVVVGDASLQRATIRNYDTRIEWYPSGDENVSLGAFYKQFRGPIEEVVLASGDQYFSFQNTRGATNLGAELEARKRLDFLAGTLEGMYVAFNLALIRSRVEIEDTGRVIVTSLRRPLQGQSPYVLNLQLGYDDSGEEGNGLTAAVLFNVFGRRITQAGAQGAPDVYEMPQPTLDLAVSKRADSGLVFRLRASNLLNPARTLKQGDQAFERGRRGINLTTGLSFSY